jgi:hypothetical protein
MALRSKIALYCYSPIAPLSAVEYAEELENLNFSTVSPGGFGQLSADIKFNDTRLPRPELALFSRVAVMDGKNCLFLGEITDPDLQYDDQTDQVTITALGIGNSLRDDPLTLSYTGQTAQQIVIDQLSRRSVYLPIDQDTTGIFPDNPSGVYSPVYSNVYMEEVVADVATLAGDYAWGVWAHPRNKDAFNFPTGQLLVHQRDTTTTTYMALDADIIKPDIQTSAERAYNVIEIWYNDPSQNPPIGKVTYTDPRLGTGGAQGTAPFRRRKYVRDLSGISTVTKAQAQAIANTYGALYQNPTNATTLQLRSIRDANGNPIPLKGVVADRNLFVPTLAPRATQLQQKVVGGVNFFYIVSATYKEDNSGNVEVDLECDNFLESPDVRIARLQLKADQLSRLGSKTTGTVQAAGAAETGFCGVNSQVSVAASTVIATAVNFKTVMSNVPSAITFHTSVSNNNTGPTATSITVYGFILTITATATALTDWFGTYTTVGN